MQSSFTFAQKPCYSVLLMPAILIFFVLGVTAASGQVTFEKQPVNDTYNSWCAVAVDLDDDGDEDMVASDRTGNRIGWWENTGNEQFAYHVVSTDAAYAMALGCADMNGDTDMVATAIELNQIAWFENDDLQFTKHPVASGFGGATWVDVHDMNHDGDPDVVGTAQYANEIAWFENSMVSSNRILMPASGEKNQVRVFPNPVTENSVMIFSLDQDVELQVALYDLLGNRVGSCQHLPVQKGENHIPFKKILQGKQPFPGLYLLSVQSGSGLHMTYRVIF